jgi:hypothetical protein
MGLNRGIELRLWRCFLSFSRRNCLPEHKFDLRINAAQIVGGPLLKVFPEVLWNAQQESLSFRRRHV